jgi:hypothetical protein
MMTSRLMARTPCKPCSIARDPRRQQIGVSAVVQSVAAPLRMIGVPWAIDTPRELK